MAHALLATLVQLLLLNVSLSHQVAPAKPDLLPRSSFALFLNKHNRARAEVGVAPLKWSETLANTTARIVSYQKIKNDCQYPNLTGIIYGRNQHRAVSQGNETLPPLRRAFDYWVEGKEYYVHENNVCVAPYECKYYTQIVWRKSVELGCAKATCVKNEEKARLTLCFYNPPGNIKGESPY
ncbi:hypothetical protein ACFE04_000834 [Oxalis oulophora]